MNQIIKIALTFQTENKNQTKQVAVPSEALNTDEGSNYTILQK